MKPLTASKPETAHDIFKHGSNFKHGFDPLQHFFSPRNVAVIGATENAGSVGRTTLWNLISTPFGGTVFPVNPKRPSVLGIKAYPDRAGDSRGGRPGGHHHARQIDPRNHPRVRRGRRQSGGRHFGRFQGSRRGRRTSSSATCWPKRKKAGIRIIGPNCLGVMIPPTGVNATFAAGMAHTGSVGFLSQSGALCTAVLDWSLREMVGFSAFVSIGSMVDVGWGDLIYYLGSDPRTAQHPDLHGDRSATPARSCRRRAKWR